MTDFAQIFPRGQARAERRRVICRKKAQHALVNGIRSMRKRHDERGKYFGGPAGEAGYCLGDIGVGFEGIHGARCTPRYHSLIFRTSAISSRKRPAGSAADSASRGPNSRDQGRLATTLPFSQT